MHRSSAWLNLLPGVLLNIKMPSNQYRVSYDKAKTVLWPSYFYNGNFYTWKFGLYIETRPWVCCILGRFIHVQYWGQLWILTTIYIWRYVVKSYWNFDCVSSVGCLTCYARRVGTQDCFNIKTIFLDKKILMMKMRWSEDHLIFIMEISMLVRLHLYIESGRCMPMVTVMVSIHVGL